jgi:hypothetical protein
MSVECSYNFASKQPTASGYANNCLALAQSIVDCSDIFTIEQAGATSTSSYKVWLRVYDTNLYLCVSNYDYYVYLAAYYGIDGYQLSNGSLTNNNYFFSNGTEPSYGTHIAKFGDFAFTVCCQSSRCNNSVYCSFAMGVSEHTGETHWFSHAGSIAAAYGDRKGCVLTALSQLSSGLNGVNTSTGVGSSYNFVCSNVTTACTTPTGASGVLNPWGYCAYNATEWLGHMKWGGKYDLYRLFDQSGAYVTNPGSTYTIDGTTYEAAFTSLFIPVECT